ncbi:hypothetical protein FRC12_004510 [Ceratobasidium sp. 428]|nr:hypothetical protein FRC12_004510 [Ceratobasidium sp. 428]
MPPIPPLPNKTLTRTEPNFENESQMGKDQVSVVNNCWSEGSYELGVIALNSFREADRRYPSPSDIRHLLALALYPPPSTSLPKRSKPGPRQSTTLSPRKLQAQTEIPSPNASRLALELLLALASTTHPEHLTAGLKSYARAPIDAAELDGAQMEVRSPLVVECVRVGRARDCWVMLREGLLARRDHGAVVRHPNDDGDDSEEEDEIGGGKGAESKCVVAPFAWGVLEWWIKLFEMDQRVQCLEEGSGLKKLYRPNCYCRIFLRDRE